MMSSVVQRHSREEKERKALEEFYKDSENGEDRGQKAKGGGEVLNFENFINDDDEDDY